MDAGTLSEYIFELLEKNESDRLYLKRCESEEDYSSFSDALTYAVDYNTYGPFVTKHTAKKLQDGGVIAFLSWDKKAGVAVWPDGNIGAVFKIKDKKHPHPKAIDELMLTALSAGGIKLDCFAGKLTSFYELFGFVPVSRTKFDKAEAPPNWNYEKFQEPDVIFWKHCGDSVETVAQKMGNLGMYPIYTDDDFEQLPCLDDYPKAYRYRDEQIEKERQNLPVTT